MEESLCIEKEFIFADLLNDSILIQPSSICKKSAKSQSLRVVITETIDADYGLYVWPCSIILSNYLWYHRSHVLKNKSVIELGAGTALPSIVARKCCNPSMVIITDKETSTR